MWLPSIERGVEVDVHGIVIYRSRSIRRQYRCESVRSIPLLDAAAMGLPSGGSMNQPERTPITLTVPRGA
jgi:hypothetical protein